MSDVFLTFIGPCIVICSYNKSQTRCIISQLYFVKQLYMFRTDLLSIIRSLITVFTATGICHTQTVNITIMTNTSCCEYSIKTPDDGQ